MTDEAIEPIAPRANPDLIGHDVAESKLRRSFESGKMAHAWLITGPRGIGKATLAYRFARFVLAGGAAQGDLMGLSGIGEGDGGLFIDPSHPVFKRVASEGHADLLTLERTRDPRSKSDRLRNEIVVGDARRLHDFLALTPAEGGWRVAVIDAVDEMNRNAANAVLKLVEEPPPRALLLLVCHVPGRVLATLRSRCRRLTLAPLPADRVAALVAQHRPDLDTDEAALLGRLADGSPGRALSLATMSGAGLYREIVRLIAAAPGIDPRALHGFGDRLARRGAEPAFATSMDLLAGWFGRLITAGARGGPFESLIDGESEAARRLLGAGSLDQWLELWEKITNLAARTDRVNLDRKHVILSVFAALESAARA